MSLITIMPSGKTIEAVEGTTLLAAILAAEVDLTHNCEGNAQCGTCHIFVHEGRKGVSKVAREENENSFHRWCGLESRLAVRQRCWALRISG